MSSGQSKRVLFLSTIASMVALSFLLSGCGAKTGTVSGKVTAEGKSVTGGTLVFSPDAANPGPPATVQVGADGNFSSTAVVIGKNTVIYNAPPAQYPPGYTPKPSEPAPESPYVGLVPETKTVEVKGNTPLEIKLVPATAAAPK